MSDYALVRTRSAAVVSSPTTLLTRTYSVPDLTSYVRSSSRYRPQWPSYYSYTSTYAPYRYYRDYSLYDDYWYDRYRYFSPLYSRSYFPRRYSYADNIPNPYYWSYPYNYWTRYKSYLYDYKYPYSSYTYPYGYSSYYSPYYSSYYTPYRSSYYDNCVIWPRRFFQWRRKYSTDPDLVYAPSLPSRPTPDQQYTTQWTTVESPSSQSEA